MDNDCSNGDSICQILGCMDPLACNYSSLANVNDNCIYASTEFCDGQDNDCDGEIDEFVTSTFYADADGDGFGDADSTVEACTLPGGFVSDNTDCDDAFWVMMILMVIIMEWVSTQPVEQQVTMKIAMIMTR